MPAFLKDEKNSWISTPRASGPFRGLQGGAVAGLLVSELEHMAEDQELGLAMSASVEFVRSSEHGILETRPEILRAGKRASTLTNVAYQDGTMTAKATVCFVKPVDILAIGDPPEAEHDPDALPVLPSRQAPHGGPWMMDSFETRASPDGIAWFRYTDELLAKVGPLARVLGPADWTHGIARPPSPKLADPNLNLQVTVFRHPSGDHIGIAPKTTWMPSGIGFGEGTLHDSKGEFGRVMMTVALTPFD